MSVSTDRWTCPYCTRTTVVDAETRDIAAALNAVRDRHAICVPRGRRIRTATRQETAR